MNKESKRRILVNATLIAVLAVVFGVSEIPGMLLVVAGVLVAEWLIIRGITWFYALDD